MGTCTEAIKYLSCASVLSNYSCSSWICLCMFSQENIVCVYMMCVSVSGTWEILVYIISMKNFDIWTTLNTRALMNNILGLSWLSCWTHKECSSKIYLRSRHCFAESCKLDRKMVHVTLLDLTVWEILVCEITSIKIFDMWTTLTARALMSNNLRLSWLSCRTFMSQCLLDRTRLVCHAIVHYVCTMRMV